MLCARKGSCPETRKHCRDPRFSNFDDDRSDDHTVIYAPVVPDWILGKILRQLAKFSLGSEYKSSEKISQSYMELLLVPFAALFIFAATGFKVDREYERGVIFRLGRTHAVKGPGIYWIAPMIDQKVQIDNRTKTINIEPQETITADSVTIKVNAVLYYRIIDPTKAITRVESYQQAVYQIALTTLRNVVGQNNLDDVLQNRDKINVKVQEIVDEVTEPWGIEIERVEMKDVEIPPSMQRAMAKEAEALREKRARIIKASAEQESSQKLTEAAQLIAANPVALELRRMQMLTEIGAENNTTTLVMIPSDFVNMAKQFGDSVAAASKSANLPLSSIGAAAALPAGTSIALTSTANEAIGQINGSIEPESAKISEKPAVS
jgi:regulator of protease activity HflC (stomatin/prohibitin superfamily)